MMKHRGFAVPILLLLTLACSLVLAATLPESQCVSDANGNGIGDVVDIMATAVAPDCQVYLPVVAANWRQPWPTPTPTITLTATPTATATVPPAESCIPSGDQNSIQSALIDDGSEAILCQSAVFELSDTIYFTHDNQEIYTQGFPTDDSRALLRIVGKDVATAVSAEGNDYVSLRNVIIDGNRPQLGIAQGALINFGRGVLDRDAEGHVVEWVKAYEPRGWTVIYLGGPCNGAVARNNEVGPAGRAEYIMADGISLDCANSVVENNTIIDVTDGGIVIFQSPGALVANNTIRAENRIMFYGISMEDYLPLEGDFRGTRVTGNVIDAAGAMIRRGIGMGPYVGCASEDENAPRSRGAVVTGNTLMGDHMAYGFVVSGVEDWTVTGNVDLSTHLTPEREWDCFGSVVDPPAGFQYNPVTSSGTFQPEFEAAVLGGSTDMFPLYPVASETCMRDLIGAEVFEDIKAGNRGDLWPALEAAPNGERIGQCISIYQPPDISDLAGNVAVELLPCAPFCAKVRLINLSEDTVDLGRAEFLLDDFLVPCLGLLASLGPWEEAHCTVEDFVIPGSHGLRWFGFPPDGGFWVFDYPFSATPTATEPLILSARIVGELKKIPMSGDLWCSTWASDDNLYVSWGDGVLVDLRHSYVGRLREVNKPWRQR
jgi:parallel beta-helix repeat protein